MTISIFRKIIFSAIFMFSSSVFAASHTGTAAATHMEIKKGLVIVCTKYNTSASSRPVANNCPNGTFTEHLFNSSWGKISARTVTIGTSSGGGERYNTIFWDGFNGNSISSNFKLANWTIPNRDTTNNINSCSQSNGKLNLSIKNVGNQRQACYLISKRKFGPGNSSTLKVEYRANVSQVKARGAWFAGWLFALGGNNSFDGNKNTGAEYDVFEYMPTWNTAYNTAIHDGGSVNLQQWIYGGNIHGIDLRKNRYYTFGVEWNKNCMVFTIDGKRVRTNTSHVSKAKNHTIFLTMEGQTGTQWGTWNVGSLKNNIANGNPATGRIDWIKVLEKKSIDPHLCS